MSEKKIRFSDEEFCLACRDFADQGRDAVARMMEMEPASVSARRTRLVKMGVNLPKFKRGPRTKVVDVESLNALLAETPETIEAE